MRSTARTLLYCIIVMLILIGFKLKETRVVEVEGNKNENVSMQVHIISDPVLMDLGTLKPGSISIDWSYPYVRWNNNTYRILTSTIVGKAQVGSKIGDVDRDLTKIRFPTISPFKDKNGDSNYLRTNTGLYRLKRNTTERYIVVKDHGVYKMAINMDTRNR